MRVFLIPKNLLFKFDSIMIKLKQEIPPDRCALGSRSDPARQVRFGIKNGSKDNVSNAEMEDLEQRGKSGMQAGDT